MVLRCSGSRTVKTPRNQIHIAVAHRQRVVDLAVARVATEEPETIFAIDAEVVDLLEFDLSLGRLVMLVRWIGRPTTFGRQHFHGDELVGFSRVCTEKVVDLAGPGTSSPDFDPDVLSIDPVRVDAPSGFGRAQGDLTRPSGCYSNVRVDGHIGEVGDCVENTCPSHEAERL